MKASLAIALLITACIVFLRPAPALADFRLCNHTTDAVRVAIAASWYDYSGNPPNYQMSTDHNVQGWTMVGAGDCAELLSVNIFTLTVLVYAYAPSNPSLKWDGQYEWCLDFKRNFNYGESVADHAYSVFDCVAKAGFYPCILVPTNPQVAGKVSAKPPCTSGKATGMRLVDTGNAGNWQMNLTKASQ